MFEDDDTRRTYFLTALALVILGGGFLLTQQFDHQMTQSFVGFLVGSAGAFVLIGLEWRYGST